MKDIYSVKLSNPSSGLACLMKNSRIVIWSAAGLHGSSVGEAFGSSIDFDRKIFSSFFKQVIGCFFCGPRQHQLFSVCAQSLPKCALSVAASIDCVANPMADGLSDAHNFSSLYVHKNIF